MNQNYNYKTIVFLEKQLADYFYQSIRFFLSINPDYKAFVIIESSDKYAPYKFTATEQLELIDKNNFKNYFDLITYIDNLKPQAICSAGWSTIVYLKVCKYFFKKIPTIVGLDNPWESNLRQKIGLFYFKFFMNNAYSHVWIAGKPQYEFARRLGFDNSKILNNLYSANTTLFGNAFKYSKPQKTIKYPKKIVFIGRYVDYKQPLLLVTLFNEILKEDKNNGWTLELIGSGPLLNDLKKFENDAIFINGFVHPNNLPKKLSESGAFCLPSKSEHWGVVVHEAAAAGLPLILSNTTYAGSDFLIHRYNGFEFNISDNLDFKDCLIRLFNASESQLLQMGERSFELSKKINHQLWAANLCSIL